VRAAGYQRAAALEVLAGERHRLVVQRGVTDASASTIGRWLHEDAIKPWRTRSWSTRPCLCREAGRVLDLYARTFEGKRLRPDEYVISANEKSQLQALGRRHPTVPAGPGRPSLVEFEHRRGDTLAYVAARDVHHANLFDRVEEKTGIVPFGACLGAALATLGTPVFAVLDDLRLLTNPRCLDAVSMLSTHVLEGSQLALLARGGPALPLASLRAHGLALELGPDDLRMDEAGAGQLLRAAGLELPQGYVAELTEQRTKAHGSCRFIPFGRC
jgi:hypothetical protein